MGVERAGSASRSDGSGQCRSVVERPLCEGVDSPYCRTCATSGLSVESQGRRAFAGFGANPSGNLPLRGKSQGISLRGSRSGYLAETQLVSWWLRRTGAG